MDNISEFFSQIDKFPCPELFEKHLEGYDDLENLWDVIKRIQKGFVEKAVKPAILGTIEDGALLEIKTRFSWEKVLLLKLEQWFVDLQLLVKM